MLFAGNTGNNDRQWKKDASSWNLTIMIKRNKIPFSTVRKRQKPEECLVYASSGFCGMAKMLYGNIILKFF